VQDGAEDEQFDLGDYNVQRRVHGEMRIVTAHRGVRAGQREPAAGLGALPLHVDAVLLGEVAIAVCPVHADGTFRE
jgi:hypothetical protein